MTLHSVVAVGGDEVEDVVVGGVCRAVGDPEDFIFIRILI